MQKSLSWKKHGLDLFNPYIGPFSGATTPGQSRPGSDGNEGVLSIPQSSNIIGTSPSDFLVSYPGNSLGESYPSAGMQSVYSPANWVSLLVIQCSLGESYPSAGMQSVYSSFPAN